MYEAGDATLDWSRVIAHSWLAGGEFHGTLDSTNQHALRRLQSLEATPTPFLIYAEEQTQGRGRGNHSWFSSPGALTFSVVWEPDRPDAGNLAPLSLLVGTAVCQSLESLVGSEALGLKWPNDVYVRNRKLAGILIESTGQHPRQYVVGIGVNVNNSFATAPADVKARGISLADVLGNFYDRTTVLVNILDRLRGLLERSGSLIHDGESPWDRFCLLRGRTVRVRTGQREIVGVCRGTQADGALQLVDANQSPQTIYSGEVIAFDQA